MPKIDLADVPSVSRTGYPLQFASEVAGRFYQRVSERYGLGDFGFNIVTLQPGAWSSQRHWHESEDEVVMMLEGEAVLVTNEGRQPFRAGDVAVFPRGDGDGHHLINEGPSPVRFLAVGPRGFNGDAHYPDIDMHFDQANARYTRKDGSPW